jgi:hypothetical protein
MSENEYKLPETFRKMVKKDFEFGLFLLEGNELLFFPA